MSINSFIVKSKIKDYKVNFLSTIELKEKINDLGEVIFVVDKNVWDPHGKGLLSSINSAKLILFDINEEQKTFAGVQILVDKIIEYSSKKNTVLAVFGGGILQDLAGFVSSTLYRGINWIFFPTTMLSQCDSCIGAKTSLNYKRYKNLLGTFYPPSEIYIIPEFLATQVESDFLSGVGELAKLFLIGGQAKTLELKSNLDLLLLRDKKILSNLTKEALMIKKKYIEEDEFDAGRRNLLNFGHCFGHAIETATNYIIPHGQAVVLGIILANQVAVARGLMSNAVFEDLSVSILRPIIKADLKSINIDKHSVVDAMKKDKKRTGEGLALVMMKDANIMLQVTDLSEIEAIKAMEAIL